MRQLSDGEKLQIRELMQMETNGLINARAMETLVDDRDLKTFVQTAIKAGEARIKGFQQFLIENKVIGAGVQ